MTPFIGPEENELEVGGLRRRLNARRCGTCRSNMCFSFVEGRLDRGLLIVPERHWARCEGCGAWEPDCVCEKGRVH